MAFCWQQTGNSDMGTAGSRDLDADAVAAGWRITEIRPGSPSASSDLIPFFDFIIGAGDVVFVSGLVRQCDPRESHVSVDERREGYVPCHSRSHWQTFGY